MKYPNGKKTETKTVRNASTSRRGMSLEADINTTNEDYLRMDVAVIHKKPTPITIVKTDYPKRELAKITEAYFKIPSTTDYNGIYKGRYIDFEAKECHSKTSFPFSSIHPHQIRHLDAVERHGAIAFLIIRMSHYEKDYLIDARTFIDYYDSRQRKSLSYEWIKENGHEIAYKYQRPCDYLNVIDKVYGL
ncbi:MAG: Holliday junction resolvase RecU [Erysipelotrichaceae bacterium]|nr:Holliday junction resolvase RecU [Erysipelotrichaceae bacterium]